MAKNKLAKFAEMETLENVFQPTHEEVFRTDYKLKGEKIKGQIDELVTALHEEKKNSFDENRKVKIANIDLEELNNIELQQLQVRISKILVERTK